MPQPILPSVETPMTRGAVILHLKERERLLRWINAAPAGAWVGVLGPQGSGKTQLAHALAEQVATDRGVPLMLITCRGRRLSAVLRECIWRVAPEASLVDDASKDDASKDDARITVRFRDVFATRPAVLVFDDLDDCDALSALALPGLVGIVASRASAVPVPSVCLREIAPDEAVELLATESGALASDAALAKICGLVQKSPFALSLVAADLAAAPSTLPSDALRLLGDEHRRLRRLTRHDDLDLAHGAALAFAYHRLSVTAQRVLRQLSVIPDAFTGELAAYVCDDAAVVIGELVRRKWLHFNSGTGRYTWQPAVRAFVRERLASSESVAAELRHAQGVVALARAITAEHATRNMAAALRNYDALRSQIDAAFARLQPDAHPLKFKAAKLLIDLCRAVAIALPHRAVAHEQAAWLSAAIGAYRTLSDVRGEMLALGQLAAFHLACDDVHAALKCYERIQRLSHERAPRSSQREPGNVETPIGQFFRTLRAEFARE
jgi:ABC-type cobalamin/Fe3+-siderophores transport system ATPase subunit